MNWFFVSWIVAVHVGLVLLAYAWWRERRLHDSAVDFICHLQCMRQAFRDAAGRVFAILNEEQGCGGERLYLDLAHELAGWPKGSPYLSMPRRPGFTLAQFGHRQTIDPEVARIEGELRVAIRGQHPAET